MTVTSEIPQGVRPITVRDTYGPVSFYGETVADLSWTYAEARAREHTRWTDITLYRLHKSVTGVKYAIHIVGRSVLYHRLEGCKRGVVTQVSRLDDERYEAMEPCTVCNPPDLDDIELSAKIRAEEDLHSLETFIDTESAVQYIYNRGVENRSNLSQKLLTAASRNDPDIAALMAGHRHI